MNGTVTIVKYNDNAHSIVSAAGRISTTSGGANNIYESSLHNGEESNIKLINKILSSGHESVLEHIMLNLSFDNVSVYVEQFMIEFRLASFTVKSRRYVDFGGMGYISPDFSDYTDESKEILKNKYDEHMEYLFEEYNYFISMGIPKEDARFVLPYSFKSNFYCTVNARELIKIMNEMVYGRGRDFPELVRLGESLFMQCKDELPYLEIEKEPYDSRVCIRKYLKTDLKKQMPGKDLVTFVQGTDKPENVICKAAALNCGISDCSNVDINNAGLQREIISEILKSSRKRELEQVNFTVIFNRMSLAGITHLVRHRMQSIVVPDYISTCNFDNYVLPDSIIDGGLEERYKNVFKESKELSGYLSENGLLRNDGVYLLLSGMTIPVMTTMNVNELYTFFRLRTCNRAQWEIKECADDLLRILREKYPVLFSFFGPSCYLTGKCPEGRMTCGKMKEVCEIYSPESET